MPYNIDTANPLLEVRAVLIAIKTVTSLCFFAHLGKKPVLGTFFLKIQAKTNQGLIITLKKLGLVEK